MAAYVLRHAGDLATKPALERHGLNGHEVLRYDALALGVQQVAAGLRATGLAPGARVLMRLGNVLDFPLVYLGALWAGCVPVATSSQLTQPEVDAMAKGLSPDLCVAQAGLPVPSDVRVVAPEALHGPDRMEAPHLGDPDRLGYVIYTSGSSGVPRPVAHAHRAIWARRMMYQGWYGLRTQDRVCHAGAFNWTYTLGVGLMDPWAMGATAILRDESLSNADLPKLLERSEATIFAAAPGVYRQALKPGIRFPSLPSLRHGLSAGEALPPRLRNAWRSRTGTEIYEALGMSECSTYISAHPGRQAPEGAVGFVQAGRRVTVLDGAGHPCPFGTPGTLAIDRRDPGLMLGYLNAPEATAARMKGGWFDTGDRATLGADGLVHFLGRDDDMMNAGGYRVSPLEVERAFATLPGLRDCAAVELPVNSETRVIALFFVGAPALDEAALKAHAEGQLARYKQPRLFLRRAALPHNANGKLNRKALRASYEAQDDQA